VLDGAPKIVRKLRGVNLALEVALRTTLAEQPRIVWNASQLQAENTAVADGFEVNTVLLSDGSRWLAPALSILVEDRHDRSRDRRGVVLTLWHWSQIRRAYATAREHL
jgi:hypothetical protein